MRKHAAWLLGQLPELIDRGILDESVAGRLRQHYEPHLSQKTSNPFFVLTGILGAVLIGIGIIALYAYNWDELSRSARAVMSVAPLVIAQGAFGYAYFKQRDSKAWTESTSGFLMLMLGASIALISQTYHLPGSMRSYLQIWMLLSIPLMYLTPSILVSLFYMIGITAWSFHAHGGEQVWFWGFFLAFVPRLYLAIREKDISIPANFLSWTTVIALPIAFTTVFEWRVSGKMILAYAVLIGLSYVLGRKYFGKGTYFWHRPFQTAAIVGTIVLSLILGFEWDFGTIDLGEMLTGNRFPQWAAMTNTIILLAGLAGMSWLIISLRRQDIRINAFIAIFPAVVLLGLVIGGGWLPMIMMNIFLFGLGIFYLREGIVREMLSLVNLGMFCIAALLTMRFLDEEVSFLIKGIVFILMGAGFLGVNLYVYRKRKEVDHGV
ncbi:MAG: DUF2157 domain-containing protein [Bacteroidota bacterium]